MTREARIPVPVGPRPCEVRIGAGFLPVSGVALAALVEPGPVLLVTDGNVAGPWLGPARESLAAAGFAPGAVVLPPGEGTKTLAAAEGLYGALVDLGADRTTPVVALGGGMVTDLAGFVAATWMRGVPWIALPTSVLAMVDASVGGKTAVNLDAGKNLVGAFHQPLAVLADLDTLATLPPRHLRNGLAEAAKAGLGLDAALFARMEEDAGRLLSGEPDALLAAIEAAVRAKAGVVARDEREADLRRVLNLGHTAGHALEAAAGYGPVLHGEAVAVGLVAACRIAAARGLLDASVEARVAALLRALGLPASAAELAVLPAADRVRAHLLADKKRAHGRLALVLPVEVGRVEVVPDGTADEVLAAIPGIPA